MKKNGDREKNNCMRGSDKGRRNCNAFSLAMENVLKGLPDKIQDQLSRHHTHANCEIVEMIDRFPVYIKTMQSCSSMFDTSSQSFQRQDDQEVHAISCFLSEADEMQYICAH